VLPRTGDYQGKHVVAAEYFRSQFMLHLSVYGSATEYSIINWIGQKDCKYLQVHFDWCKNVYSVCKILLAANMRCNIHTYCEL